MYLGAREGQLTLHDLTGFGARCDAIFLTEENMALSDEMDEQERAWRRRLRGLPVEPIDARTFDVVVVGGGVVGSAAALVAARLGDRVVLVHNRPYLGGNTSLETSLYPRGVQGPLIEEIHRRKQNGDLHAIDLLNAELKAKVFLEYTVYATKNQGSTIQSILAREAHSGREIRLSASVFINCSGRCILGLHAGAETIFG